MLYTNTINTIVRLSDSIKPSLQLAAGEKVTDSGKVNPVYVTFRLSDDYRGECSIDAMLTFLDGGNCNAKGEKQLVRVNIPATANASVRVRLYPLMTGVNAAEAIRTLSGHGKPIVNVVPPVAPPTLTDASNTVEPVLTKGKGKGKVNKGELLPASCE